MNTFKTKRQTEHLHAAADCLMVSSPSVAAYLRLARKDVLGSREELSTTLSSLAHGCNACGHQLIPGLTCQKLPSLRRTIKGKRKPASRLGPAPEDNHQRLQFQCDRCHSVTTMDKPKIHRKKCLPQIRKNVSSRTLKSASDSSKAHSVSMSPSQSARRRARNKRSTLQSVLGEQSISSHPSSGYGLDMSDFIKK